MHLKPSDYVYMLELDKMPLKCHCYLAQKKGNFFLNCSLYFLIFLKINSYHFVQYPKFFIHQYGQAFSNVFFFQPIKEECILEQLIYVAATTQH